MGEVIELFSGDAAEAAAARAEVEWLLSPRFPEDPPPEIAVILQEMQRRRESQPAASEDRPLSPKAPHLADQRERRRAE